MARPSRTKVSAEAFTQAVAWSSVAVRTHYDVLGVTHTASTDTIRNAYRRLAREHHPDRSVMSSAAGGGRDMPSINEAYRVLNDPGRRAVYDAGLRDVLRSTPPTPSADPGTADTWTTPQAMHWSDGPARVPWRSLMFFGCLAIAGIVVLAQFTDAAVEHGPDGILRNGDCVEILANSDAREVACTDGSDLVVRAFVTFDATCPGLTVAHRDRQGMGVACVRSEDG